MTPPRAEIDVHVIWSTFQREAMPAGVVERVHAVIAAKARVLGCPHVVVGGIADHVHVLVRVPPAMAVARLVQELKGASSYFINSELKQPSTFRWQSGYGAFSVSATALQMVTDYIIHQPEHHAAATTSPNMEFDVDSWRQPCSQPASGFTILDRHFSVG